MPAPPVGQPLLLSMTFVDLEDGETPRDPSDINLRYTDPNGTTTPIPFSDLINDAVGAWHYVLQTIGFLAGAYIAQLSCSGALIAVCDPETFVLAPPEVPGL